MKKKKWANLYKYFKWGDYLAIIIVIIFLMLLAFFMYKPHENSGQIYALIHYDGHEAYYPLNINRTIRIKGPLGYSVLKIKHDKIAFISSPCPRQLCIKMGAVYKVNAFIACLPNHVFVRLISRHPQNQKLDKVIF